MAPTKRKIILDLIKQRLIEAEHEVGNPATTAKFDVVGLGPLTTEAMRKHYSAGIVAGRETKADLYPFLEATFPLAIEFRVNVQTSQGDPADVAEDVLGMVQLAIGLDRTFGGVVIDTKEVANELDSETYGDKSVVGVVFYEVKYRHMRDDPTQ